MSYLISIILFLGVCHGACSLELFVGGILAPLHSLALRVNAKSQGPWHSRQVFKASSFSLNSSKEKVAFKVILASPLGRQFGLGLSDLRRNSFRIVLQFSI